MFYTSGGHKLNITSRNNSSGIGIGGSDDVDGSIQFVLLTGKSSASLLQQGSLMNMMIVMSSITNGIPYLFPELKKEVHQCLSFVAENCALFSVWARRPSWSTCSASYH